MANAIREEGNLAQQQQKQEQEQEQGGNHSTQPPMKVKFNLEATSVHKYEGEKEEDAPPSNRTWYSRRELRSFQISTHRSVVSYQDRVNQAGAAGGDAFFAGLDDDDVCVQGIEILVSSPTIRRSLLLNKRMAIQSVLQGQSHRDANPTLIALSSMSYSKASGGMSRMIGVYHESVSV